MANQAGEPGHCPSTSRRKLSLVTEGAKPQASNTSARLRPSRRPLYQVCALPQPPFPVIFRPLRSRAISRNSVPPLTGRSFTAQAPSTSSPRETRSIATSIAGRLCGSTSANGSGRSLTASSDCAAAGRRRRWRSATMMPPSASGRRTKPLMIELRRPRSQASLIRRRSSPRLSIRVPKPSKRSISTCARRSSEPVVCCACALPCCSSTACQAFKSSCGRRPLT